ncbi:DUF6932 family protein [Bacillaceae bacterium W0354]
MKFNDFGLLPPGDYELTIDQLRKSLLVIGPQNNSMWDTEWRAYLVNQLEIMVKQLWNVGVNEIFIDGSFVENKAHPNDIDGYFECDVKKLPTLIRELNIQEPDKIWTWDSQTRRHTKDIQKNNFQCGINIVLNYILIMDLDQELGFKTKMEMIYCFRLHLDKQEIHSSLKE